VRDENIRSASENQKSQVLNWQSEDFFGNIILDIISVVKFYILSIKPYKTEYKTEFFLISSYSRKSRLLKCSRF
jgi:hypothetical protein